MNTLNDKDFNLIEDFISGNLSPEEEKIFRGRLEKEENLARAYRFRSKMAKYWNEADSYETTKEKIKEILKKEQFKKKRLVTYLYAAASVVILIGLTFFFVQQQKQGSLDHKLTNIENDTSASTISSLSINKQPEKGSQFVIPPEYTQHDTLIIQRNKDFMDSETIYIKRTTDTAIIKEYVLRSGEDSLLIPLKEIQPGNYQWILIGSKLSGSFIIKENPRTKK
ncbi:MAG: hypothetical protein JXB49_34095 [Bacteroidales bacterium]|nr:hypothetical protein [Bacteroidales bacterium]